MKIWLTQIGEQLPLDGNARKMRTALLADEFVRRGHGVTWWASAFDHSSKKFIFENDEEVSLQDNYKIRVLFGIKYNKNISLRRYWDHQAISRKLYEQACRAEKPDIIVVSMPDHLTAFQAVRYAKSRNIPVVVDVRDEWPDLFVEAVPRFLQPSARHFLKNDLENTAQLLAHSNGITSMMETLHLWALKKAGRERTWMDRVFHLGTMPPRPVDASILPGDVYALKEKVQNRFVLLYIGTFGKHNDPTILLKAARELKASGKGDRFSFIIAGDGKYFADIEKAAKDLNNVFLPGWVGQNEISFLMSLSTVGVIPSTSVRNEFPNKAFTYLSAGLPIIASTRGELAEIIQMNKVGSRYEPNDYIGLTRNLVELESKSGEILAMSANAKKIFHERFHAEKIYGDFADHVEKIASAHDLSRQP